MGSLSYVCVDCGLTATKAVVISSRGEELGSALDKTDVVARGDTNEIAMDAHWRKTAGVIRQAIARAGMRASDIAGVGASGHGGGMYPLDANGRPVCNAFTSMDSRAQGILDRWAREGVSCYNRTRHHPWAGQPIPQLRWLKENRQDLFCRIRWVLGAKDWVSFNLTGEPSADSTDASNSGFVNLLTGGGDPEILKAFGVPEVSGMLPALRRGHDMVGKVTAAAAEATGLPAGTPVIAGLYDVMACALGSGVYDAGKYSIIAGTWNINTVFEGRLVDTAPSVKCSLGTDGSLYAYVESSATSAGNLEWFVDRVIRAFAPELSNDRIYQLMNTEVEKIGPADSGVLYMPFLYRSHLSKSMDASFFGIRAEHGAFHLLRAMMEGVVFAHRRHLDVLTTSGLSRRAAVLSGGAVNSPVWCRMFADITGLTIEAARASQAGALGVAVCAAVGTGVFGGFAEAVGQMVGEGKIYTPDAGVRETYQRKYDRFSHIIDTLDAGE